MSSGLTQCSYNSLQISIEEKMPSREVYLLPRHVEMSLQVDASRAHCFSHRNHDHNHNHGLDSSTTSSNPDDIQKFPHDTSSGHRVEQTWALPTILVPSRSILPRRSFASEGSLLMRTIQPPRALPSDSYPRVVQAGLYRLHASC
jgi:hypothetical protein